MTHDDVAGGSEVDARHRAEGHAVSQVLPVLDLKQQQQGVGRHSEGERETVSRLQYHGWPAQQRRFPVLVVGR